MNVRVRPGALPDAPRIAEIYNEGIAERIATFETSPRSDADILAWFDGDHIVCVAEASGCVCGFAVAHPYSARPCYRGIAEVSVYVAAASRGRGVGRLLVCGLEEAAVARGKWKLIGRIFAENKHSLTLTAALGFRVVGVHENHAQLDGVWKDVVIVEKGLHKRNGRASVGGS